MKYSGIGGQAVMEGVMMRNGNKYAVAVRRSDREIEVKTAEINSISDKHKFFKLPFVRGVVNFIESLYLGMKALTFSSSFYDEEDRMRHDKDEKKENKEAIFTVILSIILAIVLFMVIPFALSGLFAGMVKSEIGLTAIEGLIRIAVLIAYMVIISNVRDIHRVYMYHGAEHKCINCIENGLPLTIPNVRKQTRRHKRCGTSFLLYVVLLSIVLFMFIRTDNIVLRLLLRIILVPVIASIVYEFIRIAGRYDNIFVKILAEPGLMLQGLTTREPDDSMIQVGIESVEAVFDWQVFIADFVKNGNKEKAEVAKVFTPDKSAEVKGDLDKRSGKEEADIGDVAVEALSEVKIEARAEAPAKENAANEEAKPVKVTEAAESVPLIKRRQAASPEAAAAARRKAVASRVRPVRTLKEENKLEDKVPVKDEDDEILSALDRFFNNERAEENARKAREDRSGKLR